MIVTAVFRNCRLASNATGLLKRVVPVDNCVIFYIPDKSKKLVTVIRVMYSGRDIDKQLDESTYY